MRMQTELTDYNIANIGSELIVGEVLTLLSLSPNRRPFLLHLVTSPCIAIFGLEVI